MLTGLNVVSGSCISKLIGWKFSSFLILSCHFLSKPLFSFWMKNVSFSFTWLSCVKKCSAAKSDENIIVEGEKNIKAAEKDPSATIVASVCSTGATVAGSINTTELISGKGEHGLPHFYYCSVAKWMLQFHSDPLFALAAKCFIIFIITIFVTITFVFASFTDVLYSIGKKPCTKLRLFR